MSAKAFIKKILNADLDGFAVVSENRNAADITTCRSAIRSGGELFKDEHAVNRISLSEHCGYRR